MNRGLAKRLSMNTISLAMTVRDGLVSEPNNNRENEHPILYLILQRVILWRNNVIVNIINEMLELSLSQVFIFYWPVGVKMFST